MRKSLHNNLHLVGMCTQHLFDGIDRFHIRLSESTVDSESLIFGSRGADLPQGVYK